MTNKMLNERRMANWGGANITVNHESEKTSVIYSSTRGETLTKLIEAFNALSYAFRVLANDISDEWDKLQEQFKIMEREFYYYKSPSKSILAKQHFPLIKNTCKPSQFINNKPRYMVRKII